ncbi:glycosyltransferase [Pseudorhodoplanes sp.]|uniref:glycosyltransferase n=1 Tax=Pseudorhodoplanes sp. TaxID=1934341 RepID=UPI003D129132
MLSVIIPTHESERVLVRTLACLVPGATAGLIREVILADGGSTDETAEVGDVAGCRFLPLPGPVGPRLDFAVSSARGDWLLFVPAGSVLEPGWVAELQQFIDRASAGLAPTGIAAAFSDAPPPQGEGSMLRAVLAVWRARRKSLAPGRGLLISKASLRELGGFGNQNDPEADVLRRIGKRRLTMLRTGIVTPSDT